MSNSDPTPIVSGRLLTNIPCKVCSDHSSGKHYGIYACDGCAGFFKRSIRRGRKYECKSRLGSGGGCAVDKTHRNQCRSCRLNKCLQAGMNKEAVQHERGPRHSTIRRQMLQAGILNCSSSSSPSSSSTLIGKAACSPVVYSKEDFHQPSSIQPFPSSLASPSSTSAHLTSQHAASSSSSSPPSSSSFTCTGSILGVGLQMRPNPFLSGLGLQPTGLEFPHYGSSPMEAFLYSTTPALYQPLPKFVAQQYVQHVALQYAASMAQSAESIWEMAARLLFVTINWIKNIPAFLSLPTKDQVLLLEERWSELFVLNAAQFELNLHSGLLLKIAGETKPEPGSSPINGESSSSSNNNNNNNTKLSGEFRILRDLINKFREMQIDPAEYSCLRGIVIFRPVLSKCDSARRLEEPEVVSQLQDQAQLSLNKYVEATRPTQPLRFGKLLLLLPSLSQVSSESIERLFFRSTFGPVKVERIISDIYKTSDGKQQLTSS